jgi:hypothetical protein
MGGYVEDTTLWAAMTPPFYDDDPKPVRQHASPPSDSEIGLAFALMLDLADRIDEFAQSYCDATTRTGRAIQAALLLAKTHQMGMLRLRAAETIAAGIVIEAIGKFIAAKPGKATRTDERSVLRNLSSMLLLGGSSSYKLGEVLDADPSALRKRLKTDLHAIEQRFGRFPNNNKEVRKKWHLPQTTIPLRYNDSQNCEPSGGAAAALGPGIDPDFDAKEDLLFDTLTRALFD